MDDRDLDRSTLEDPILSLTAGNEAPYSDVLAYFAAKRQILRTAKSKIPPVENELLLQACNKLYHTGRKLFSEAHYDLLAKYSAFSADIIVAMRPAVIKNLFGNYRESDEIVAQRLFILAMLHKHGVITNKNGKISDPQDWIRYLNKIDAAKLDQYERVFVQLEFIAPQDPEFFAQIKAHNDLDSLAESDIPAVLAFQKSYELPNTFTEDTQIKGFTLISEYICKKTRYPKEWKTAIQTAWDMPSVEASFELYKLYSERKHWLNRYANLPLIRSFLNYFYNKPIFTVFAAEPLTQACSLLQAAGELNIEHFKLIADMAETGLAYCQLLDSKELLTGENLEKIKDIPESILRNICHANKTRGLTVTTLNVLLRLGQQQIDATAWMEYKPNWLLLAKLSNKSLITLGSLALSEKIFLNIKRLHENKFTEIFEILTPDQQELVLNDDLEDELVFKNLKQIQDLNFLEVFQLLSPEHQNVLLIDEGVSNKILNLLSHLHRLGILNSSNVQAVFAAQQQLLDDNQLYNTLTNLEKTSVKKDQKKFNHFMQIGDRTPASTRSVERSTDILPVLTTNTLLDEELTKHVSQTLHNIGITMHAEELGAYSPAVLNAFYATLPIFQEDNLLSQDTVKNLLRIFSTAPDPKVRCQCIILLSQCGLLNPTKLTTFISKLELAYQDNPNLFNEVYAEAWVQTETNSKWLEQRFGTNAEDLEDVSMGISAETLTQRFLLSNEENSAFLALDDTKYQIARHGRPAVLQQVIKLLDKSNLRIANILEDLLQINEQQIQKVYYWLSILDRSGLLHPANVKQLLNHQQTVVGDIQHLKTIVMTLKEQSEILMHTIFTQKMLDQLLNPDTPALSKQRILDYLQTAVQNPSTTAKFVYIVSDAADVAGEKAVVVQDQLRRTAGEVAAAASDMTQKASAYAYSKLKMFSNTAWLATNKPATVDPLPTHMLIARQSPDFPNSYYQSHEDHLQQDLTTLQSGGLLNEENVEWLMQQPRQENLGRCLRLLATVNLLQDGEDWQQKVTELSNCDRKELDQIETKCQRVLQSNASSQVKENTMQFWIVSMLQNAGNSPKQ